MSEANPDDGLMADISQEYKLNRPRFLQNAKAWVERYAKEDLHQDRKRKASDTQDGEPSVKEPQKDEDSQ